MKTEKVGQTSSSKLLWTIVSWHQLLPLAYCWWKQPTVTLAHAFCKNGDTLTVSEVSAGAAAAAVACKFQSCAEAGTAWAPGTPWSSITFHKSHDLSPVEKPENREDEELQVSQFPLFVDYELVNVPILIHICNININITSTFHSVMDTHIGTEELSHLCVFSPEGKWAGVMLLY